VALPPLPAPIPIVHLPTLASPIVALSPVVELPQVELPVLDAVVPELAPAASHMVELTPVPAPLSSPLPAQPDLSETQLAQRVLSVVQKQIDGMIDFRLKEAMAPILARHSEALVRDLRDELSRTMADVVARAVTQEMAKLRQR
jgi:hypothetical protein